MADQHVTFYVVSEDDRSAEEFATNLVKELGHSGAVRLCRFNRWDDILGLICPAEDEDLAEDRILH
jgi:hypothetical protein